MNTQKGFAPILLILLGLVIIGGVGGYLYIKKYCPGQNLYTYYTSLKLGVSCNDNLPIKENGKTVGYAVVPGGENDLSKLYDEKFNSDTNKNTGINNQVNYSNVNLGVSINYDRTIFSVIENKKFGQELGRINVLIKKDSASETLPGTSLLIISQQAVPSDDSEYETVQDLLKKLESSYEGLDGYKFSTITINGREFVEVESSNFADGKTIQREFFNFNRKGEDKNIRIIYQFIPNDESGKKMETLLNSIQFI